MRNLAILILSHNTKDDVARCLGALHDAPPIVSHEIVLIDNASADGTVEHVHATWPQVRVIEQPTNVGFARANNEGIRQTSSELVLLLNSDTVVPPGSIDRIVEALRTLPGATIIGPRLLDGDGHPELSFGSMMSPLAELRQKVIVKLGSRRRIAAMTAHARVVDWVSGACLLVRRRDAEAAGLLDERYFMYCEDVDFCAAVRARGGIVYFAPVAEVVHLRGRSGARAPGATGAAYRRSQIAFYQKHHPAWAPILRLYLRLRGKLPPASADIET